MRLLKSLSFLSIIFFLFSNYAFSQTVSDKAYILQKTDTVALKKMSLEFKDDFLKEKNKAIQWAASKNLPIRKELENGRTIELQRINHKGFPVYYTTHNKNAAATTSTDKIQEGGENFFQLSGTNMTAGVWDAGAVLTNHIEFLKDGFSRVTRMDGNQNLSNHATHVTGTICAQGINAEARGMAFDAKVHSYDWNSDLSEMTTAAANGLLLSNHSYGQISGWYWDGSWQWAGDESISATEDYRFGFYGNKARSFDIIARNAPYYLIIKSAGNDRGEGPSNASPPVDGGYDGFDCIPSAGIAKNILTIGAAHDMPNGYTGKPEDVRITSFSSFGPADDGRVKPDIVGNGQGLLSTSSQGTDEYSSSSGTSMSAPNVTGTLLLLQEYFHKLNGYFMTSATLKALAIHTAHAAGTGPEPDYIFGWGLLNGLGAANLISHNGCDAFISEQTYEGSPIEIPLYANGNEPLIVTAVWTDLPGSPPEPQLNPRDIILVNDLDIKLANDDGDFYPYVLNPVTPSVPATTGVNDVDNVEKIYIEAPEAGLYTLHISHKGSISGDTQDFSLIVSGLESDCATRFTADSLGYSAIELSWAPWTSTNNVLLAWASDNKIGNPEDFSKPEEGDILPGGGEVLYFGNENSEFVHSGLRASNAYFYKAWVQLETGEYTPGIPLMHQLPTGNPSSFVASDSRVGAVELSWEMNGNADRVLLAKSADGLFGIPEDSSLPEEGEIEGGGIILASGDISEFIHEGLEPDMKYHYKLWSFIDDEYYSEGVTVVGKSKPLPVIDGEMQGKDKVYTGAEERYRVPRIEGIDYKWVLPEGWEGESTTNFIEVIVGRASGKLSVIPVEDGFEGVKKSMDVEVLKPQSGALADFDINMFPNPAKNELKLSFSKDYEEVTVKLIEMTGKQARTHIYNSPLVVTLDISNLEAGTYIIEMNLNNESIVSSYFIKL